MSNFMTLLISFQIRKNLEVRFHDGCKSFKLLVVALKFVLADDVAI